MDTTDSNVVNLELPERLKSVTVYGSVGTQVIPCKKIGIMDMLFIVAINERGYITHAFNFEDTKMMTFNYELQEE